MKENVTLLLGDCAEKLKEIPDESVDLVVTSPPYDNLRQYKGYSFEFEKIAGELARLIRVGGVIVWVVGDATIHRSETGTSFKQALHFKENLGLNLYDTMIYSKHGMPTDPRLRYYQRFEFMFILSKGVPKTFNPIADIKSSDRPYKRMDRRGDDLIYFDRRSHTPEYSVRGNIWYYDSRNMRTGHPASFPLPLAKDHIISWSNEGDTVLDPFMGSGTTGVAAIELNRKFIGIEIAPEYFEMAKTRITTTDQKPSEIIEQNKIPQETEYDNIFD